MKSGLLKHIFRKIKDNYKRFLSLLLMALLGVGFYAGIQACSPDLLKTLDIFFDNNDVYDIEIVSNLGLTDDDVKYLSKIDGIDKVVGTYSKDVYLNVDNNQYVVKLIGINNEVNKVYLKEGRLPDNNNEIVVDEALLNENNIKINDNITLEDKVYKIVGIVVSPLYFSSERPITTLGNGKVNYYIYLLDDVIKTEVFTNVYININGTKNKLTNSDDYNELVENVISNIKNIKSDREEERYNDLYGEIINNSKKYGITIDESKFTKPKWYIFDRLNNDSYKEMINASDNIKKLGNIFPLIFFAIAILVSLISMMRMIEEDRTENGTLKSLGYNSFEITLKYVIYSFLATVVGSTLGVFIGSYLIPYVIWNIYKKIFFIPKFIYTIDSISNLFGLVICLLCICGTAIFVSGNSLREVPANLMRPKPPKSGKKILLERISILWRKLKFSDKITIRNIFRYKSRVFTTIFGIAGCTALILAGFGLKDSIKDVTDYQFNYIFKYDKIMVINEDKNYNLIKDDLSNDPLVDKLVAINTQSLTVSSNDKKQDVTAIIPLNFDELEDVISLVNIDNNKSINNLSGNNTCIISEKTSRLLKVGVNDQITILDSDNNKKKIMISYITKNYINQYLYMSKDTYQEIFNNYNVNSFLIDLKETSKEEKDAFNKKYISKGYATSIVNNEDIKESISEVLSSIDSIVAILIIAAAALAFVVLYNLSNINISERKKEIATLKVLGFYPSEVDKYINRETVILTVIGITIGLLSGSYLCHFIISTCEPDYIMFDRNVYTISFIYSALITILFTIIVNIVTHYNLKKINMIASLKNVE